MAEPDFDELEEGLDGVLVPEAEESLAQRRLAIVIRRANDLNEPLLGKRARFLMTSHTREGDWLAHGWKEDLRIVSDSEDIPGLDEPGVWIQEERDYYGDEPSSNRFAVGVSRLWVEQYVSAVAPADDSSSTAWLDNLNRDPNSPEIRALASVEGHPDPVGARVVIIGDQIETDIRAVSPVRMTNGGDLAITVMAERDWYRWARDYPAQPHPSLRWEHTVNVLVE